MTDVDRPTAYPSVGSTGLQSLERYSMTACALTPPRDQTHDMSRSPDRRTSNPSWVLGVMPTPPTSPPPEILNSVKNNSVIQHSLHNLLGVSTKNPDRYFLTRRCCYIFHCMSLNVNFKYPVIPNKFILQDDRVKVSVELAATTEFDDRGLDPHKDSKTYRALIAKHTARANHLLNTMKTAISTSLIRLTGYVLFKVFSRLLMSVTVNRSQLDVIERASNKDVPLIFVPLHRSHVDYLFVTWVLFNLQIPAPIVAAGDNLRIPVFGCLLRGLGGFFIKRRLESSKTKKDVVYRSLLQTYISHSLQAGYNMEFFIEGGRTRTGKPCMPKGGLLSVIVDAYMNAALDDALIVPIAINYDKILDGNFIKEQLGQNKVPESFWGATRAIFKVLCTNYGYARIDFGQPFSLKEFVQNSQIAMPQYHNNTPPDTPPSSEPSTQTLGHHRSLSSPVGPPSMTLQRTLSSSNNKGLNIPPNGNLIGARSNSSLFGTEVNDDYRQLVNSLASHIVYDAERCQAIMSTNAVAWLLAFAFRDGCSLHSLAHALDSLRETLQARGRDTGFSGDSCHVILHVIKLLGSGLIRVEEDGAIVDNQKFEINPLTKLEEVRISPVTLLPNVIELNYYANALTPLFAMDSIVATTILTLVDCNIWSYNNFHLDVSVQFDKIVTKATRLATILKNEFLYVPSCSRIEDKIRDALDRLSYIGFIVQNETLQPPHWPEDSDSDNEAPFHQTSYTITPTTRNCERIGVWVNMITPLLDAYYCAAHNLRRLVKRQVTDKQFILETTEMINKRLTDNTFVFGESIAADPIRNAIKYFEQEKIIESCFHDTARVLFLRPNYNSEEILDPIIAEINSYRAPHIK